MSYSPAPVDDTTYRYLYPPPEVFLDMLQLRALPETQAILAARARALAQVEAADGDEQGEITLSFLLGGSSYSLPAVSVREVHPLNTYTRLPGVPSQIVGLVNVRGRLLAALDIRPLLAVPVTPLTSNALLLILGVGDTLVGLVADVIADVRQARLALVAPPSSGAGQPTPWLRGVDAQLSLHLDPVALIADPRLVIHEEG